MQYLYDNSEDNRRNPDRPPKRVRWGQSSTDEMGDLWIQVLPRTAEDTKLLVASFGPKVMAEDAAGYEKLLEVDPGSVRLHDEAAASYLALQSTVCRAGRNTICGSRRMLWCGTWRRGPYRPYGSQAWRAALARTRAT